MSSVFYHCWFDPREPEPYCHLGTPVVLSIATLRQSFAGRIYVVDLSETPRDWSYFPEKFDFEVVRHTPSFRQVAAAVREWKHLSRIPDVHAVAASRGVEHAVYSDADVFWLGSPPPPSIRFTFNGFNSGYYHYNPAVAAEFISLFNSYCIRAAHDLRFRNRLKKYCWYDGWYGVWDEMVLPFMMRKHPGLFSICPKEEHITTGNLALVDLAEATAFHANPSSLSNPYPRPGGNRQHSPGIYALTIKEISERTQGILDEDDFVTIFAHTELDEFRYRQFSLAAIRDRLHLGARAGSPWHTELDCFLPGATPVRGAWKRIRGHYWGIRHRIRHRTGVPKTFRGLPDAPKERTATAL